MLLELKKITIEIYGKRKIKPKTIQILYNLYEQVSRGLYMNEPPAIAHSLAVAATTSNNLQLS